MEKFWNWWKKDKRYVLALKALLAALLPILCCLVYCGSQGKSIGDVYLPASEWNDELFYFKQVEGIVKYGYPQGYFGFNESHALKLSFAAWSPVLVFPWILWGMLFGWNLLSPVLCNIFLLTLAAALFVLLTKPGWRQMGILALLFCLYTPFVRYMLSGMPEIICFSLLILFYGLAYNYLQRETAGKLTLLLVMGVVMTLMRPYLLLFLFLPLFFLVRRKGWKGVPAALAVLGIAVAGYGLIKHYLGAEYFADLFFTDWVSAFFERGLFGGIRYFFGKLYYMGRDFLGHTVQGFRTGLASGAFFAGFLAVMLVLAGQSLQDFRTWRKKKEKSSPLFLLELHLLFSFVGMFFALLLMYKLTEGSKHLLTFIAAGIFLVSLMRTRYFKKAALLGAVFLYFYTYMALDPYDYQVPFAEPGLEARVESWGEQLKGRMALSGQETPGYENVVIWVLWDEVDGKLKSSEWQLLYALPEGMGISCCKDDYVTAHFEELQSRYLAANAGGAVDALCAQAGYEELLRDESMVLYRCR